MINLWRKHWVTLFIALTPIMGGLGIFSLALDIGRPFGGFIAYPAPVDWIIASETPAWWQGIAQTGLDYDDDLERLDGKPYGDGHADIYATAYARKDSLIELVVVRDDKEITLEVPVLPFTVAH